MVDIGLKLQAGLEGELLNICHEHEETQKWERRHVEGSTNSSPKVRIRNVEDTEEGEFKKEKAKVTRKASKLQFLEQKEGLFLGDRGDH